MVKKPRVRPSLMLAAFFQEQEVRQLLAGRGVHTPGEIDQRIEEWKRGRQLLERSPDWAAAACPEVLEPPAQLADRVAELSQTDAFRSTVEGLPHRIAVVSLGQLVAFQFTVDKPYCDTFTVAAGRTVEDIATITLPKAPPKCSVNVGRDQAGFVLSAPGPNLRVAAMEFQASEGGPLRMTVDFTLGSPFVQVAEFGGRMILRNGYHRVVSLLTQGVSHAPVILLQCGDYGQTGAAGPGFFAPHIVMGPKPPLLKHYLSPFAIEFNAIDYHKAIRLRPDEFQVAVPE
ncbi:MAG TPA: hypothetical protein VM716_04965 [Gemmatimonadales bacterium]|nr:hypothetical protein [Gemmatimonadales bacterium]